jgi:hypothetical protein
MRLVSDILRQAVFLSGAASFAAQLTAQELQPRAYVPTPIGLNYFGTSYSNSKGGWLLDPGLPVQNVNVRANIATVTFAQTLSVLGRTAQAGVVLPYLEANLDGLLSGTQADLHRSGLGDITFRYAMNLYGARAMHIKEFLDYSPKTIIGVSVVVTAPTGQYDPNAAVNIGTDRWGFKPEVGVSRTVGKWSLESAAGVWLYTANNHYIGKSIRAQVPLGSFQAHIVRNLPRRSWVSLDGTFYTGGRTNVNGQDNANYQADVRLGVTYNLTLTPRQSIKINYFNGAYARVGNDNRSIGMSYNLIWKRGL